MGKRYYQCESTFFKQGRVTSKTKKIILIFTLVESNHLKEKNKKPVYIQSKALCKTFNCTTEAHKRELYIFSTFFMYLNKFSRKRKRRMHLFFA